MRYEGKGQPPIVASGIGTWWNPTPRYEGPTPAAMRYEDPAACAPAMPVIPALPVPQVAETCAPPPRAIAILIPRDETGERKR